MTATQTAPEIAFAARLCEQCNGDLVRVEGALQCGNCGWPANRPLPKKPRLDVLAASETDAMRKRVAELERENAALRKSARPARAGKKG